MPGIVTRASKWDRVSSCDDAPDAAKAGPAAPPANDDRKSAIIIVRRRGIFGDAADALFQEIKRRIAEKDWV